MPTDKKIYLALPNYDNRMEVRAFDPLVSAFKHGVVTIQPRGHSLLAHNFNALWCDALNLRKTKGITHFLMMHNDIIPMQTNWLEILIQEMDANQAEVISVVSPLKNHMGLTSTAINMAGKVIRKIINQNGDVVDFEDPWACRRLSMTELFQINETFTDDQLLINTGLFIADITKPWAEKVHFEINEKIIQLEDGKFVALVEPEDWNFSRQLHYHGVKPWATRKVEICHAGKNDYLNNNPWGQIDTDPNWKDPE